MIKLLLELDWVIIAIDISGQSDSCVIAKIIQPHKIKCG